MTETFTWPVQHSDTGETTYRTRTAQFGDGYAQVSGDGLNGAQQEWSITYTGPRDAVLAVKAFLDARQGYQSFYWTNPLGELGLYRAEGVSIQPLGGVAFKLTATFTQAFVP